MKPIHRRTEWGWLGRLARGSARHRVLVLAIAALAMGGLAFGLPRLTFEDNPIDAMPTGHPNTLAAENLTYRFPGSAYASPVFVSVDPSKWATANEQLPNRVPLDDARLQAVGAGEPLPNQAIDLLNMLLQQGSAGQPQGAPPVAAAVPGPTNITDEVYMRGMHELFLYLQQRVPELKWAITLESQVRLVNYTNTGIPGPATGAGAQAIKEPDPAAFAMPGTDPQGALQYSAAWSTYYAASPASVRSIVSKDWGSTRLAFLFAPGDKSIAQVGDDLQDAVDEYRADVERCDAGQGCSLTWNVFEHDTIMVDPRAPTAAAAHLTETTLEDLFLLGPIAILFIGAMLFAAFRRIGTVLAMTLPLSVAGFGVLGAFGWLGLPIHSVSLLVFPVLIGTGIDFGIHMAASYHAARAKGREPLDAAYDAGQGAGVPLMVVTITTLVGMLFLIFAPNRLLEQLGLAVLLGLSLLLVVALTALPAALSWTSTPPPRRTLVDRFLVRNAAFWGRFRVLGIGLVIVLMAAALVAAPMLKTLVIGTPAAFFPEDDRQRRDFEKSNDRYFDDQQDLVTNVLVLEGDLTTPAAQAMLKDLEAELKTLDFVRKDSVVSIHFALNAWIQVRQGTAGAPAVIAQESAAPGSTFPQDQAGIKALMDEMFDTPLETYATFFVDPYGDPARGLAPYHIGVLLVEIAQPSEFKGLEREWDAINQLVARLQREHGDAGLSVHMAGASAIAYLFTAKELPYLQVASLIGLVVTALQVLVLRRSLRDALVVAAVVVAAGLWWMGLLVALDIPLSIALVVPVVILEAIGSDYALHLRYAVAHEGRSAWGDVGRAIWYSALTDIGAFLVFTRVRYGLLADATLATVMVLLCALVATLILVPALAAKKELPLPGSTAPIPEALPA